MRQPTTKWTRCRAKLLTGLALFCFCVSGVTTNAQTDKRLGLRREVVKGEVALKLDELLSRYAGYGFSGTVLAAKDGQIILNKGYGLADRERNISNAANTAFDIASITKTFTAAATSR